MSEINPYEVLGVDRQADPAAIKMAYRKLSKLHHPDVNGTGDDTQFKIICTAWEILSDPEAKAFFDQTGLVQKTGEEALRQEMVKILKKGFDDVVALLFEQGVEIKSFNIIGQMKLNFTNGLTDIERQVEIQKRQISDLKEMKEMISAGDGVENVFAVRIDEMIGERQKILVEFVNAHKIIDLALTEAGKYTNIVQMMQGFSVFTTWSNSSSNSTTGRNY